MKKKVLLDIPEPDTSLMSFNGDTRVTIKISNQYTEKSSIHKVYLLGYASEDHTSFNFVFVNKWRRDHIATLKNALTAKKYSGDPATEIPFRYWIPPCWVIETEESNSDNNYNLHIEFISCLPGYHKRFKKKHKRRLYSKHINLRQVDLDL